MLSEESLLLVKNWDTVEEIRRAEKQLRRELSSILRSLKPELVEKDWWENGWFFVEHRENQVYIGNQSWRENDNFLVWIGVEKFDPERISGGESPPILYVWVWGKHYDLAQMLIQWIGESKHEVLGELDLASNAYVVRSTLRRCLPEEAEAFGEAVREQIMTFFAHYAKVLWSFDAEIRAYISNLGRDSATITA
jgi:hypothetical protein